MPKVDSAEIAMKAINPDVKVVKYAERMTSENVLDVISGYDVIVDGTDNFPTRYLLNDASLVAGIPVVHGSIYQFEGSVTVYKPLRRALLPLPVSRSRRRPSWRRRAPRAASWASCPA